MNFNKMLKSVSCINCNSTNFVKHGLTTKGVQRYRCLQCSKTWTSSKEKVVGIDLAKLSQQYLDGKTTRELVKYYPTSPVRINHQIRSYLTECPDWLDYIDSIIPFHNPKQIYLSGKKFHCSWKSSESNEMFVAFAIDSMTGFVIAYKVSCGESNDIWVELLNNLKSRTIKVSSFLTNGSEKSQNALAQIFPEADKRITYHRIYRDKELSCCLSRISPGAKLVSDAARIYFSNENTKLAVYLGYNDEKQLFEFLQQNQVQLTEIVKSRLVARTKMFNDSLPNLFQKRFEKFHLLRDSPYPIINSWVANQMLTNDDNGLTKLSLYTQDPYKIQFKHFVKNKIKNVTYQKTENGLLKRLLLEVSARGLELPIFRNDCEFNFEKCILI